MSLLHSLIGMFARLRTQMSFYNERKHITYVMIATMCSVCMFYSCKTGSRMWTWCPT